MNKNVIVWLKRNAQHAMLEEAKQWKEKETGGILIGYWGDEHTVVITSVVGPGPKAKHTAISFLPDQKFHEQEVERIYRESNRTETYLGDWHTHPNASAYLSGQDKKTLKKIARYKPARLAKPLMLIHGTAPMQWKIWYYQKHRFVLHSFTQCDYILFE